MRRRGKYSKKYHVSDKIVEKLQEIGLSFWKLFTKLLILMDQAQQAQGPAP